MKKFLFLIALLPSFAMAQTDELGLTGGFSLNGQPSANMFYRGTKSAFNYAGSVTYLHNPMFSEHFQLGFDIYVHSLASKSSNTFPYMGDVIGGDNKRFEYAKALIAPDFIVDYKGSIGEDAYIYGGLAIGAAYAIDNHKSTNPNYTYKGPDGGVGGNFGLQAGVVYGLTPRIAVNAELAMRYYYLFYDAPAPYHDGEQLHYGILAMPFTVGIRYRLGFEKMYNLSTGKYMILRN